MTESAITILTAVIGAAGSIIAALIARRGEPKNPKRPRQVYCELAKDASSQIETTAASATKRR